MGRSKLNNQVIGASHQVSPRQKRKSVMDNVEIMGLSLCGMVLWILWVSMCWCYIWWKQEQEQPSGVIQTEHTNGFMLAQTNHGKMRMASDHPPSYEDDLEQNKEKPP